MLSNGLARVLCNGKTLAFQAKDTGSIPVTRSRSITFSFELNGLTPLRCLKYPQINLPVMRQSSMATFATTGEFLHMQRLHLVIK